MDIVLAWIRRHAILDRVIAGATVTIGTAEAESPEPVATAAISANAGRTSLAGRCFGARAVDQQDLRSPRSNLFCFPTAPRLDAGFIDAGPFDPPPPGDGGRGPDASAPLPNSPLADVDDGCGCRTSSSPSGLNFGGWRLGGLLVVLWRRRSSLPDAA